MKLKACIALFLFTVLAIYSIDARGARAGGSRGGGARVRGGSRSSTGSRLYTSRSSYSGPRYSSGSWKTAAAVGTLYGVTSYQRRRLYRDNPDREPTICFNEKNLRNGTFGYFICPEEGQEDKMASCCGEDDAQHCCEGMSAAVIGAIVGGIFGFLIIVTVIVIIVCVIRNKRRYANKGSTVPAQSWSMNTTSTTASNTYTTPNAPEPSGLNGYSNVYSTPYSVTGDQTNDYKPAPIGFEGNGTMPAGNPPPYSESGKY